jgi:hypothetical protein
VAEGWKLVPVEPTDEWCRELAKKAYGSGFVGEKTTLRFCGNVIRDVLAAAPTQQQEGGK